MKTATSATTIEQLRAIFAVHGLPQIIVSDNGSVFTSQEFAGFTKYNGIKHVKVAPFHPASKGLAERAVQTFKSVMDKMTQDNSSVETKVSRFLFKYRLTPHSTTGQSPSEMLMQRKICSRLDLPRPDLEHKVHLKQHNHDKRAKERNFQAGDLVYARNYARGKTWLPGQVIAKQGPLSYTVKMQDGRVWRRHTDQIILRYKPENQNDMQNFSPPLPDFPYFAPGDNVRPEGEEANGEPQQPEVPSSRRPKRVIKLPK